MGRCLLVVLWSSTVMALTLGSLINGPQPMTDVAPVGAMVTFTCAVNTTELPANTSLFGGGFGWIVNGVMLSTSIDQETANGSLEISTLQLPVIKDYITGVPVLCEVGVRVSGILMALSSSATLTAYGPPEAPSNLTSTQSASSNALILSWSAPSSPVQLHYTVTVNTSTTTITVTNDTTITITREQVMAAINSTECDIYTFSVTATNPAGSSMPANLTTPVTFIPAPDVTVSTSTNSSTLYIMVLQSSSDFSAINVSVESVNSCTDKKSYTNEMPFVGNNSWSFNITDPQNWTNITVVAMNQCKTVSVPVNINHSNKCTPTTTPTNHTMTATSPLPSSTAAMSLPVWGTAVAIVGVLVVALTVIITIIGGYCLWRKKRSKPCYNSSVKPIESTSDEQLINYFKQDKSVPQPAVPMSALPEYMTPAEARKEEVAGKQSTLNSGHAQPTSPEYAQPSSVVNHKQLVDTAMYSDVWQNSKPPAPPPPTTGSDEYSNLQHNLGGGPQQQHQVDQDQLMYDSAQGDQPQYSTLAEQKTKYADLQISPSTGLEIRGNTSSTVQYSVVGDTTNMEYNVVGPKTASSQDCPPPLPPPPSADVVKDVM